MRNGVGEMTVECHVHLESLRTDVAVLCLDAVALCKERLHLSIWFYIRISNRRIAMKLNTDPVASKLPPLAVRQEPKLAIPRILHMKLSAASNFIDAPPQTECKILSCHWKVARHICTSDRLRGCRPDTVWVVV